MTEHFAQVCVLYAQKIEKDSQLFSKVRSWDAGKKVSNILVIGKGPQKSKMNLQLFETGRFKDRWLLKLAGTLSFGAV